MNYFKFSLKILLLFMEKNIFEIKDSCLYFKIIVDT